MGIFAARRRKDKDKEKKEEPKEEKQEVPAAKFSPALTGVEQEEPPVKEFHTKPQVKHQEIFSPAEEPTAEPAKRGRKKSQKVKLREIQIYQAVWSAGRKGIKKGDIAKQTGITDYLIYQSLKTLEANEKIELIENTRFWRSRD